MFADVNHRNMTCDQLSAPSVPCGYLRDAAAPALGTDPAKRVFDGRFTREALGTDPTKRLVFG